MGRLKHDEIIGLSPLSTIKSHMGAKYTLHWPSLDEYCTKVKRQASIMYPKDATSAVHLLDLFPGAHVLEAGTGNGSMTLYIQRAIQAPGSHLDTVDIRNEHSQQAEKNIERFWRGMYRPGITFWRSVGGLQKVIRHLKGETDDALRTANPHSPSSSGTPVTSGVKGDSEIMCDKDGRPLTPLEIKRQKFMETKEVLPPNPHPKGHQYDAISLDLPDCKSVLFDLLPLLKPDRPMCLYMVNMSQILELVQWMRQNCDDYTVERILEVDWKEWNVRSAAVRSKVRGRVHVGGLGKVLPLQQAKKDDNEEHQETKEALATTAADNIPDDAVGWICRPLHMPVGHTGFLVQLRKNSTNTELESTPSTFSS
ncbi:S-adenosyl-L-methionine-dependent methyltransferase [Gamsiella multidivaricata]|uniref:S-adenosyl-L-methionine-dependent methyltransferase n=1 Tax=Gamsiella multidivaricata TaxID=101098 RepID=UPI00221F36DD|nr:S-adenosyl-L-methionine-dependent methyltransferase [Gamsiella multidivaricata]KAI7817478.1 S-adenosyl-L-methionine-dependent methyltransferase [Gamsiella multidivaricata]